jgi:hypothetical protein
MVAPLNLPPLPANYWEAHRAPLMADVASLLQNEPSVIYEVALLIQQTLHTLAMGVFATFMVVSNERKSAWDDFVVSVQLTKAALLFFRHFKLLSLCMVSKLIEGTPCHKVHSKALLVKYASLLEEIGKLPQTEADRVALESAQIALKKHVSFLQMDLKLSTQVIDKRVYFFHGDGVNLWKDYLPGYAIDPSGPLTPEQLRFAKILEATFNPPDPGISVDDPFDHSPEDILALLNKAREFQDREIAKFAEIYAKKWNERVCAVPNSTHFQEHSAAFTELFKSHKLPYRLLQWVPSPEDEKNTELAQEVALLPTVAIQNVEKSPSYEGYKIGVKCLVNALEGKELENYCLHVEEELLAHPAFLSPQEKRQIIEIQATYHFKYLIHSKKQFVAQAENHLMTLRRLALQNDLVDLFALIDRRLMDAHTERKQKLQEPALLNDLVKQRKERMARLNQTLKQPIELK